MSGKCNCGEIFTTHPPGFDFSIDESAGKSSTTNTYVSMVHLHRLLVGEDVQELFFTGMVLRFAVLGYILLILVGGSKGSSSTHKFMREIGFVFGDLEDRKKDVQGGQTSGLREGEVQNRGPRPLGSHDETIP